MIDATDGDAPGAVRDRVLLLVGFAGALRRSELVALTVADLERRPRGLLVHLRRAQTDQAGQKTAVEADDLGACRRAARSSDLRINLLIYQLVSHRSSMCGLDVEETDVGLILQNVRPPIVTETGRDGGHDKPDYSGFHENLARQVLRSGCTRPA